jgi:multiple sugar transport system substrate-binding protein
MLRMAGMLAAGSLAPSLLAACGANQTATPTSANPAGAGATAPAAGAAKPSGTLVEWGFGTDNTLAKARVDAFAQAYPDIALEVVPEINDQKILTAVASGDVPDLLWLGRDSIVGWAARGALEPMGDLMGRDGFALDQFYESAAREVQYEGQTWAVPQFANVRALWVNLDPLEEAGLQLDAIQNATWEQLSEYSAQLTKKQGNAISRWGFDTKAHDGFFWMYAWGNGGRLVGDDGMTVTFDDPKNIEALQYIVDVTNAQGGRQTQQAFADTWGWDAQHPFILNQVGLTLYENWLLSMIARFAPEHNFAVLPFKGRDGETVSMASGLSWAIPRGAKNKEAAWEFIKFMSLPETWKIGAQAQKQENAANNAPYIPSLTASQAADRVLIEEVYEPMDAKFDDVIKLFPQLLETSRSIPTSPVAKELNDILTHEAINPALLGSKAPADALNTAQEKAQQAINAVGG